MDNLNRQTGNLAVIIPVYNAVGYLQTAVDSVLEQPYKQIEIVLVNDGSTDGSDKLCDALAQENDRIHVLHQANGGVSAARNRGIEYVLNTLHLGDKKSYIAFLDADDVWMPEFWNEENVQILFDKHDLIGFQSVYCNNNMSRYMSPLEAAEGKHHGGVDAIWLTANWSFASMLYSCELLQTYRIRFHEELKYTEDKIFQMSCLYVANMIYIKNAIFYLYRENAQSSIHTRRFGIPYFSYIIDTYICLDYDMEQYQNEDRGKLIEGRKLASIYVMDMAEEYFKHFGSKKVFLETMTEHPAWTDLVEGNDPEIPRNALYGRFEKNQNAYIIRCYCKGIVECMIRRLFLIPFVYKIRERKKYPKRF